MFDSYVYETPAEILQLENGDYTAQIQSVTPKNYNNGNEFLEVKVAVKGFPGYVPNVIVINDTPKLGELKANGQPITEDDIKMASGRISRFLDSFGIQDKNPMNFTSWKGHVGTVHCAEQYDKNEPDKKSKKFKQLTAILPKTNKQSAQLDAVRVSATENKPAAKLPPKVAQTVQAVASDGFPEDIPF